MYSYLTDFRRIMKKTKIGNEKLFGEWINSHKRKMRGGYKRK